MKETKLTPRERVFITLDHQEPDRVPLDIWMSPAAKKKLCHAFGLPLHTDPFGKWHDGLMEKFHIDIRRPEPIYVGPAHKTLADGSWKGLLGEVRKGYGIGVPIINPLKQTTDINEIIAYPLPPVEYFDFSGLANYSQRNAQYALIGGSKFSFFTEACDLMGMDQVMINMIDAPELVHVLFKKLVDMHLTRTARWLDEAPHSIDILLIADDYGGDQNLLVSPASWRKFMKPELQRIFDFAASRGLKTMLHSDGAIRSIIPDLIEMGLDILNPIEPEATGMLPTTIKRDFGDALVLHGGLSVRNLTKNTPVQVEAEVKRLISDVGPGGGFILTCTNHILEDVPIENVIAMYETASQFGKY